MIHLKKYLLLFFPFVVNAQVKITQLDDRFRIEVNDQLFAEWQHKAWFAPYLYPVIGPDGTNITRHYPMKEGVEGELQDHPHHRSIKFSHRDVNGFAFWAPNGEPGSRDCEIKLHKVEKITNGDSGELILLNHWIGSGRLIVKERMRLAFHPLPRRQMLMDYDSEFLATEENVTFGDNKDGGLGIRVASTMAVKNRVSETGNGVITNSNGLTNEASWGKRAKWSDYSGPSRKGNWVGITIFDHPRNLRYPTHWHARNYGLNTANRFGTGHFEKKDGVEMGTGAFTIEKGQALKLRHRLYFHHGNVEQADIEKYWQDYSENSSE